MPSLKDAATLTAELVELAVRLHEELTEGDVDFPRLTELADDVGARADALAGTFAELGRTIAAPLGDGPPQTG